MTSLEGPVFPAGVYVTYSCRVITPGDFTYSDLTYCLSGGVEKVVYIYPPTDRQKSLTLNTCNLYCFDMVACQTWDDQGSTAEERSLIQITGQ